MPVQVSFADAILTARAFAGRRGEYVRASQELLTLGAAPLLVDSGRKAWTTYDTPMAFVPAVRSIVLCYLAGTALFTLGLLAGRIL